MYFGVGRLLIGSALLYGGPIGYTHISKEPQRVSCGRMIWLLAQSLPPSPASKRENLLT
jgi:hypothetical protein